MRRLTTYPVLLHACVDVRVTSDLKLAACRFYVDISTYEFYECDQRFGPSAQSEIPSYISLFSYEFLPFFCSPFLYTFVLA